MYYKPYYYTASKLVQCLQETPFSALLLLLFLLSQTGRGTYIILHILLLFVVEKNDFSHSTAQIKFTIVVFVKLIFTEN